MPRKLLNAIGLTLILTFMFLILFSGCGGADADGTDDTKIPQTLSPPAEQPPKGSGSPEDTSIDNEPPENEENSAGILIAYFSHTGNTENMANLIHENIGGDLFEIVTVDPYPEDYDTCVAQAKREKADSYRPALSSGVTDIDSYSVVFIGYPCWISTMPMACFTFLETYDLSGKEVIPFSSYGGTGWGESLDDVKTLCPDSTILEGLAVRRDGGSSLPGDIEKWLKKIGQL